jgi:hypothetical protein
MALIAGSSMASKMPIMEIVKTTSTKVKDLLSFLPFSAFLKQPWNNYSKSINQVKGKI